MALLERFLPRPTAGLSRGDLQALRDVTAYLDELQQGLGGAAYEHVVQGVDDAVPLQIAQAASKGVIRAAFLGFNADSRVHRLILGLEGWDADIVCRLGRVLAVLKNMSGAALPGCLAGLEFFSALASITAGCLEHMPAPPQAWMLNGARCLELLALAAADQTALVEVLFAGAAAEHCNRNGHRRLLRMSGLFEVLAAAPERTLAGARGLDVQGRCSFIQLLGSAELASWPQLLDFLFEALARGGIHESEAALGSLAGCEAARLRAARLLVSKHAVQRRAAVWVLVKAGTHEARALLEERLGAEKSAQVREQIEEAVRALRALESLPSVAAPAEGQGYAAINGQWIRIAPRPALPEDTPLPASLRDELRLTINEANREARRQFELLKRQRAQLSAEEEEHFDGPREYIEPYSASAIGELIEVLSGKLDPRRASAATKGLTRRGGRHYRDVLKPYQQKLALSLSGPGITPHHLARLHALDISPVGNWAAALLNSVHWGRLPAQLLRQVADAAGDFRGVLAVCAPLGGGAVEVISELLERPYPLVFDAQTRGQLWHAVAEHLDMIDQALGLAPPTQASMPYRSVRALELLSMLPAAPKRYLPALVDFAINADVQEKALARSLLAAAPVRDLIVPLLASGAQGRRIAAAQWLAERHEREAIPHLMAALARENTDSARAVMLSTLAALGGDLAEQFSEERLLAEARSGLVNTRSHVQRCLPLEDVPALNWADGRPVPPEVVRWWVILADKLKNARGSPLLNLALDRLQQAGAERLGLLALSSFIAFDTRRPSEEDAHAHAQAHADSLLESYRDEQPDLTREQAVALLKARRLSVYMQNAIEHRGVLALARRAPGREAVNIVTAYFREHAARTAQCKALLDALAGNPSPLTLQFLLGISVRHRTAGLRAHAAALVSALAEERGWTHEELTDRTVPTAGLDERGALELVSGESTVVATLDSDMKVVLRNSQGQLVKALPAGTVTGARRALSQLRKELKQTVPQQIARLYEYMCTARVWRALDFGALLLGHPIMARLCQRLIFAAVNAGGQRVATFRPRADGSLTGNLDDPLELAAFPGVRLAHRVLLAEDEAAAWQRHLRDHEVSPLFEQLARPVLTLDGAAGAAAAIKEREGYMLDTFTLRALAGKLGYERGAVQDGGAFFTYEKPFSTAQLAALIDFTGSPPTEPNVACALLGLRFVRSDASDTQALALSAVPAVLLSETWNDLRTIAAAGTGFDPDWQEKTRW